MHPTNNPVLAAATPTDSPELLALPQRQKVVLVMDLVESVRLMAANELAVVDHWRGFVRHATTHVLPQHEGRMVKSLGDGIMVEFESPRNATNAAVQLHRYFDTVNAALPPEQQLYLRAGLNTAQVYIDDIDIYGSGVNLAARVASLAGPGETMVTAEVRDGLTDGLDAKVEDMGECYLKHVAQPVRAFRVGEAGPEAILTPQKDYLVSAHLAIAVIPFSTKSNEPTHFAIGELLADAVIVQLSQARGVKVISRLSTTAFRQRNASLGDIAHHLGANYVLNGTYLPTSHGSNSKMIVMAELSDVRSNQILWAERLDSHVGDLFDGDSKIVMTISQNVQKIILGIEIKKVQLHSLPTLESGTLFLGGIGLMHRGSSRDFQKSQDILLHLSERHRKHAQIWAWLANWHALKVTQNQSNAPAKDISLAFKYVQTALDIDSTCSLGLTVNGALCMNLAKDQTKAIEILDDATSANANEPLAWLFKGVVHGFVGNKTLAKQASNLGMTLSPLDPMRPYLECLAASAALSCHDLPKAIELSKKSIGANRLHPSTYRILAISQSLAGDIEAAKRTVANLRRLLPAYSINDFKRESGFMCGPNGQLFSAALMAAGLDND
jgi:adenylate cyclase